jgi:alkanesulfonate monooxygenase SsuD/methylene tetrahydromethanopterin reductase-like flavin-dependent oxidoreductase (luciferase family)
VRRRDVRRTAGFFWDAVQAAGGRRLRPLQSREAIDLMRGVWDANRPGRLNVDRDSYSVHGAERGPAPEIPIWIGAHKPELQALAGRTADGWLPSLPVMEPGGLPRGNTIIDDAARTRRAQPLLATRSTRSVAQDPCVVRRVDAGHGRWHAQSAWVAAVPTSRC